MNLNIIQIIRVKIGFISIYSGFLQQSGKNEQNFCLIEFSSYKDF